MIKVVLKTNRPQLESRNVRFSWEVSKAEKLEAYIRYQKHLSGLGELVESSLNFVIDSDLSFNKLYRKGERFLSHESETKSETNLVTESATNSATKFVTPEEKPADLK